MQKRTKEQWLKRLDEIGKGKTEYRLMEQWDSETSVELYCAYYTDFTPALITEEEIKALDEEYKDEQGSLWLVHLYAYYENQQIRYEGVLYTNVETGENMGINLTMDAELKSALDERFKEYLERRKLWQN